MSKKRWVATILVILIAVLLNVCVIRFVKPVERRTLNVEVTLSADKKNGFEMFYSQASIKKPEFTAKNSSLVNYNNVGKDKVLTYSVGATAKALRMDFGSGESTTKIKSIVIQKDGKTKTIEANQLQDVVDSKMIEKSNEDKTLAIKAWGEDPYVVWDSSNWGMEGISDNSMQPPMLALKIFICLIIDVIFLVVLRYFKKVAMIPIELYQNRWLIINLAKNDFKTQFAGSYLGIIWAFVQPVITVLVYWFVFEKGLKAGGINTKAGVSVPFVLWLVAGIVPWFFFQDALNGGTNALVQYSYLVKKVVFKISVLPIVKVISALFVHLFFIVFTLLLYSAYHYYPDLYTLQILYYSFCMILFVLGLVYATCAVVVFFKDLTQIINIVLQVGIWMTPIMWNIDTMELNPVLITIFKLNPMFYVVSGYRDSLINKIGFWKNPELTLYFWIVTILLFGLGTMIFRKLKVHFADVL